MRPRLLPVVNVLQDPFNSRPVEVTRGTVSEERKYGGSEVQRGRKIKSRENKVKNTKKKKENR